MIRAASPGFACHSQAALGYFRSWRVPAEGRPHDQLAPAIVLYEPSDYRGSAIRSGQPLTHPPARRHLSPAFQGPDARPRGFSPRLLALLDMTAAFRAWQFVPVRPWRAQFQEQYLLF